MSKKNMFLGENLDEELPSGMLDFFKRNKLQCRIFYEDGSYSDFYRKFSGSYTLDIKKKKYFVVPHCIVKGKYPVISWYFNNPMPINFKYQKSKVTALSLLEDAKKNRLSDEEKQIYGNVTLDSEGMNALFNTRLLQGLYSGNGLSVKSLIIILVVLAVIIIVILQVTGTIDIQSIISG